MTTPASSTFPQKVDLRHLCQPIQSQGDRGTCLAFSATAAHEVAQVVTASVIADLAEEVLYWGCKQVDQNVIPGTSFYAASTALTKWGQPEESLWPYDPLRIDTNSSYQPPAAAIDPSVCMRTSLIQIAADTPTIKTTLINGQPAMLGIQMSVPLLYPVNGHIALPQPSEMLAEGHAMLIVGYDEATAGQGEWTIRNSWGIGWGDDGYGYLPYRYIEQYGGEAWTIA
ncbi:MAG: hypothetical protein QOF33_674 [Thermomicrobiales bacterium]|jgi:C1A family cysteine protease|nr:hypothetical protein [Thermomicrobiales bacterium]